MGDIKIDLHTHSILSPDGGLSERDYTQLLEKGILDVIAITDHFRIDFAQKMQKKFGERIIVGEEIWSSEGEIIGLFLQEPIASDLSAEETVLQIKSQGGLVCIPHPFETFRHGVPEQIVGEIIKGIDIIEVFNGRSLQPKTRVLAQKFISDFHKAPACSSDAHCRLGVGRTYSIISEVPTAKTLATLLQKGTRQEKSAPFLSHACQKFNRVKKLLNFT